MPSFIGMGTNEVRLKVPHDICVQSLGPLLRKAGYRCAFGGKNHTPTDLSKHMLADGYRFLTRDERDGLAAFVRAHCPPLPDNFGIPDKEPESIDIDYTGKRSFRRYAREQWSEQTCPTAHG